VRIIERRDENTNLLNFRLPVEFVGSKDLVQLHIVEHQEKKATAKSKADLL
jgi:hypothetical protein